MAWLLMFTVYLLFVLNDSDRGEWDEIKINEPQINKPQITEPRTTYRDPKSERENSQIVTSSVIEYLIGRKGEIVERTDDKYTYKVDLFNKVEQSENWYSWNLGIFDKWDYCDSTEKELCLIFNDGQLCGNSVGRSSHIHIICDIGDKDKTQQHLYDITEPITCSYHMKLFIPSICKLINNNIKNIFAGNNNNNQSNGDTNSVNMNVNAVGNNVNIIGDTSDLMDTLKAINNKQNAENELDHLWKLCLMSLMVDDESKLNKIKKKAKIYMLKSLVTTNGYDVDIDKEQTEICDFYMEQMLNLQQKERKKIDPALPQNNEHLIDNNDDTSSKGLIGAMLNENAKENDNDNGNDEVVPDEFEGDKIVFRSGSNAKTSDNDITNEDDEDITNEDVTDENAEDINNVEAVANVDNAANVPEQVKVQHDL